LRRRPEAVLAGVDALGVDTAPRSLPVSWRRTRRGAYLAGGVFDPVTMLQGWRRLIDRTRAEAIRACAVLGNDLGSRCPARAPAVVRAEINRFFVDHDVIGVCAYDKRSSTRLLRRITWSHSGAASTGAPFDPRLSLRVRRTATARRPARGRGRPGQPRCPAGRLRAPVRRRG